MEIKNYKFNENNLKYVKTSELFENKISTYRVILKFSNNKKHIINCVDEADMIQTYNLIADKINNN